MDGAITMIIKTRISIINPEAWDGILSLCLASAKRQPSKTNIIYKYAQNLALSIGAIVIIEGAQT